MFPVLRKELIELGVHQARESAQHVGEIFLRIDAAPAAALDDPIDHRAAPAGLWVADEEPTTLVRERSS